MYRIESKVDTSSEQFTKNRERMLRLVDEYRDRLSEVRRGGPEKAIKRHKDRGKLTARERIDKLLDRGSPFLELSPLAAFEMHKQKNGTDSAPSAGVVTGIGAINGRECLIVANDATVKGGTYFPKQSASTSARRKSPGKTTSPASTSSIPAACSCRCRPRSSRIETTSAASSTTRRG